jgi:hypothetical protein
MCQNSYIVKVEWALRLVLLSALGGLVATLPNSCLDASQGADRTDVLK